MVKTIKAECRPLGRDKDKWAPCSIGERSRIALLLRDKKAVADPIAGFEYRRTE